MLTKIVKEKLIQARGVIGFFPAHGKGDDIELYTSDSRDTVQGTLFGIRQQEQKQAEQPYLAMGDLVAPKESGVKDYVGMFAVSAGFGSVSPLFTSAQFTSKASTHLN